MNPNINVKKMQDIFDRLIAREHYGTDGYFRYQKTLLSVEAVLLRKLGFTTDKLSSLSDLNKIKRYSFISKMFSKWHQFDKIPFTYAKKVIRDGNYVKFDSIPYLDVQIKYDSRPAIITVPGINIKADVFVPTSSIFKFGLTLLENIDPIVLDGLMKVNIKITSQGIDKDIAYKFPLDSSYSTFADPFFEVGTNWIDSYIDLSAFSNKKIDIKISAQFEKHGKKIFPAAVPSIALSSAQIVAKKKENNCKRIIVICCEALTDPKFLEEYHSVNIDMPNYDKLSGDSTVYKRAYTQNDSTLGSMGSILTGLYGSQHGIMNYDSNHNVYETATLSPLIKTFPEALKTRKFLTMAGVTESRTHPAYGWARGFDSFYYVFPPWADTVPNADWGKRVLETMKGSDGLFYFHCDWLHWPTISFGHTKSPHLYPSEILESAALDELTLNLYIDRLFQLDRQIGEIIFYLKETQQYDNTLIVLTGDHGSYLPPWGYQERCAFYERHIRVPLIIKWPGWAQKKPNVLHKPQEATFGVMQAVYSALNMDLPDYFDALPQMDERYKDFCITETLMHPERQDYAISMISDHYKYIMFVKVDWKEYLIKEFEGERLHQIDPHTGHVDEEKEVAGEYSDMCKMYRKSGLDFLKRNLDFQKRYPARNFRNNTIGWDPPKSNMLKNRLSKFKRIVLP